MLTRKCATGRSWQLFRHLQEVSDYSKTYPHLKEWERINAISLDESNRKGQIGPYSGCPFGRGDAFHRLQLQGRTRNSPYRYSAGGRRGKRADPAPGDYGRRVVSAR